MRPSLKQRGALAAVTISSLCCAHCGLIESTTTGELGNLSFSYDAKDELFNFNKPIALGAKLRITVRDAGGAPGTGADVKSAATNNPSVAKVVSFEDSDVIVEGLADGEFALEVSAEVGFPAESKEDRVSMLVREPEVLKIGHACKSFGANKAYYLVGHHIELTFEMELADGQDVIGYDYYPIELDNPDLATLTRGHEEAKIFKFTLGSRPGDLLISSTVDDTKATIGIVDEAAIDGARMLGAEKDLGAIGTLRRVRPTVGGEDICSSELDREVSSLTPDICKVTKGDKPEYVRFEFEPGSLNETCQFEVTYPGGNGGEGMTQVLEISTDI